MRVTILDYGVGNLHSLAKAVAAAGGDACVVADPRRAVETDLLVLPGVGAFAAASARLVEARAALRDAIVGGLPTLGICLGMQLLFDASDEGPGKGLGVIPGRVVRLGTAHVPHIGWNEVRGTPTSPASVALLQWAYFANSFVCRPIDDRVVVAWTEQDDERFPAAVRTGATLGVQFHPEKSSRAGVALLERLFAEVAA